MQWLVVNTLFQGRWIIGSRETRKLGPCWKLQPVIRTVNMELRSELCLWAETTLTPGSEFLMDQIGLWWILNNNETEIPEDQLEEYALKLSAKDFACRSKAKAKPQRREPAGSSPRIVPIERRNWVGIEPGKYSLSEYEVSKKVIYLLRHSQQVHREEDGAVHFWRIKENLRNQFPQSIHWSDDRWKACLAAGGEVKRRFQYCTDDPGAIVYFRALQGHSGRDLIDPSLQDNVVVPSRVFQHIYHVGCAFNLHSIINSGLISAGQNSSKRQTVFFLLVDPMDKSHKDPKVIDLNVPRHAQYLHNAWERHQDAVYWVDSNLAIRKGLTLYQTRSNAIILQEILPAYCIPKVVRLKTGEVLCEKVYMPPRPPPKISLRHKWTKELGSKVVQQPEGETVRQQEGEVVRQTKFFQSTEPTPNPIRDRLGRHDKMKDGRNTSRSQEINVNSFNEELSSSDRTGRPVETEVNQTRSSEDSKSLNVEQTHDRTGRLVTDTAAVQDDSQVYHEGNTLNVDDEVLRKRIEKSIVVHDENHEPLMVNEADMDFRIPGLPHSVVKHAQSTSVRQLIQKIENHPDRHALQQDLRQSKSLNPFSPESKQMIRMLGTSNSVNYSRQNPKRSAQYAYHTRTLASSTARVGTSCVKEERRISNSSSIRWTFFQSLSTSSRKDDLTDIDRETGNTFRPTSWRRNARKSSSKESMTGSYDMKHSVIEWFKMVATKMFVDNGMLLKMKIIPTIWSLKNIIITRVIGGLLQTRQVPILCQWSTDLTLNKHCLPCSNKNKKKKELHKRPRILTEINNVHRVLLLLHGGVGNVHGGLLIPMKVTMEMNQVLIEQGDLLYKYLEQFFKAWISWIHLLCYRWIVYSWRVV